MPDGMSDANLSLETKLRIQLTMGLGVLLYLIFTPKMLCVNHTVHLVQTVDAGWPIMNSWTHTHTHKL